MGKLRVNLPGQSQEDTAEDEFELKEVEVVTAPLAESFETTMFATEIIKGDPDDWRELFKVDRNAGLNCIVTSPDGLITAAAGSDGIIYSIDENAGGKLKTVKVSDSNADGLEENSSVRSPAAPTHGRVELNQDDLPLLHTEGPPEEHAGRHLRPGVRVECRLVTIVFHPKTSEGVPILYAGTDEGYNQDGAKPGKIYVVDLSTSTITNTFEGHTDIVTDLAASPNGKTLISVSCDKSARIWDISNEGGGGKEVKVIKEERNVLSVTILPDSDYFCTGGHATIFVYDMTKGDYELLTKLEGHTSFIMSLTSSSDGTRLFSGSQDNTVKIWDTSSQHADQWTLFKTLVGHTDDVNSLSLSPCFRHLATGSNDKTIRVWSVEVGALLRTIESPEMTKVKGVSYGSDNTIYSASTDGSMRAWNLGAKAQEPLKLEGHTGAIIAVAISGDGSTAISGSILSDDSEIGENSVRVWDAQTGEQKALLEGHTDWVISVDISKDGKLAVSAGFRDKTVIIWSLELEAKELKKIDFGKPVSAVTFSPDEESLFAGGEDGLLKQYSVNNGEPIKEFKGHADPVRSLKITSDGNHLVSASEDKKIIVWNVKSGEKVLTLEGHTSAIWGVDLAPDDSKIVSASYDKTAKLWDFKTGKLLHTFEGHSSEVWSVAVHPSGDFIATGSADKTWKLWSLHPPYSLLYTSHDSHTGIITSVAFSPDGNSLISGSEDFTVNIAHATPHLYLPPFVHKVIFKRDCNLEEESSNNYDWNNTTTIALLKRNPTFLIEPRFDDNSLQTLAHHAAQIGKSAFLTAVLSIPNDDTEDDSEKGIVGWQSRQKNAFIPLLLRDAQNQTPLALAVNAESGPVVKILLDLYILLLSQAYALPFFKLQSDTSQTPHPSSLFPLDELNLALSKFPQLALAFLSQLSLNTSGDHLVQQGVARHELGPTSRLIVGSTSRVPQNFWKDTLKQPDKNGKVPQDSGVPVTAKFVPLKNIAAPNSTFLATVVNTAAETRNYTVFENEVLATIVQHKWEKYVRRKFINLMLLNICMVISMTCDVLLESTLSQSEGFFLKIPTAALCLYFIKVEAFDLISAKSLLSHFSNFWNFLDFISLGSIVVAYTLRFSGVDDWATVCFALALPLSYLNTLYYMQGFEGSGQLVRMISGIIRGIGSFMLILVVCMIGFAFGFYILYEAGPGEYASAGGSGSGEGDVVDGPYGMDTPWMALFSGFLLLLGDFNVEEFNASVSFGTTLLLFVVFMFFINIVMLNLLIAIMGDIFDNVQENANSEFLFARAEIIIEIENMLSTSDLKNEEWFPIWLQVLVPTQSDEDNGSSDVWQGKMRALRKTMTDVEAKLGSEISDLKAKLQESDAKREIADAKREMAEKESREKADKIEEMLAVVCAHIEEKEKGGLGWLVKGAKKS
ncbi:hypothetical protein TrVE_jg422 [Triparma verrucosa]|uniref:Ion transport domain-containing protein n=1 Tax=Triparma verrucosa TaxID=1606542 RepID=A0A9W7ET00_9STRA|nr:hypothetical protein TrVE_jg422 [Triparma verrucosa]